jgi:uncharacterized membrane protein
MRLTGKGMVIALALSVTANLFLLGFLGARYLHPGRTQHGPHHGPFFGRPGSRDEVVATMMERRREVIHAQRERLRTSQRAVAGALTAQPYQPEDLRRALEQLRATSAQVQASMHDALLEVAPKLSAEQRERLARHGRGLMIGRGR